MEKMPKVSILVPVYNHGKFIAQMLEGALAQQVNFEYEIVIGDDASTDNSAEIIQAYSQRYPQIKAYLHATNLGPSSPRELGGKNNVAFIFGKAQGEYIALCEGDDYWTDPQKLQKQVDFLDQHPDFALTHHQLEVIYEDGSESHPFNHSDQKEVSTLVDLYKDEEWILGTASTVFRNVFKNGLAPWWWKSASGDIGIFMQAVKFGKIKYFPETMGCYRKHRGGMTNIHTPQNYFFLENRKQMFEALLTESDKDLQKTLTKTIQRYEEILESLKLSQ